MKICIIGTGYVGLVTGACFAEMGNRVVCVDSNEQKLNTLNNKQIPLYEPGLEPMVVRGIENKKLSFTNSIKDGLKDAVVCFIAVGTPSDEDGSADLTHVLNVATSIGEELENDIIVVDKSTVPVGTAEKVRETIQNELGKRKNDLKISVASNPEFLKEGSAVNDFMTPDRIIIGVDDDYGKQILTQLYSPFSLKNDRVITMSPKEAEMTKYVANSMLATKISFMNEVALLCDKLNVDVESVRTGIGSDSRIGYSFIYPGCGYGGSCLPKDIKALIKTGNNNDVNLNILKEVEKRNESQKQILFKKLTSHLGDDLSNKKVAVWGLSFKPGTDDLREAPSFQLIKNLIEAGASVSAYDPIAKKNCLKKWPNDWFSETKLKLANSAYDALNNSDSMVLVTEWKEFRSIDTTELKKRMNNPLIIDGRNQYDPKMLKEEGIMYEGIGR